MRRPERRPNRAGGVVAASGLPQTGPVPDTLRPTLTVPSRDDIAAAAELIAEHVRRTPVVGVEWAPGRRASLKLELLQHAASFKPRGAFTNVLGAPAPPTRLVAASGGNHGLAVAHVGHVLAIPTDIVVPTTAPAVKVEGIRRRGATVHQVGTTYAEAAALATELAAGPGVLSVHAYDSLPTVTGQGTLGLELDEQAGVDTILVAVGGGGLVGGVAAWWSGRARIVAVEPRTCPTLHDALAAGSPVDVTPSGVAMDSLGASRIGSIGLASVVAAEAASVLVEDAEIMAARAWLWRELRLATETGGATAMAALLSGAYVPEPDERVAVIVCGGNTDPADLPLT